MKTVSYFPTLSHFVLGLMSTRLRKEIHDVTNFPTNKSKLQVVRSLNSCS